MLTARLPASSTRGKNRGFSWHAHSTRSNLFLACSQHALQSLLEGGKENRGPVAPWVWRCFRRAFGFDSMILVVRLHPGPCCLPNLSFVADAAQTFGNSNARGIFWRRPMPSWHTRTYSNMKEGAKRKRANFP